MDVVRKLGMLDVAGLMSGANKESNSTESWSSVPCLYSINDHEAAWVPLMLPALFLLLLLFFAAFELLWNSATGSVVITSPPVCTQVPKRAKACRRET